MTWLGDPSGKEIWRGVMVIGERVRWGCERSMRKPFQWYWNNGIPKAPPLFCEGKWVGIYSDEGGKVGERGKLDKNS